MTRKQLMTFTALYFLARLIFYPLILRGEEGIFAEIFLYQPIGPDYSQMGRLDGVTIYGIIEHPALIYEVLRYWGFFWSALIDYSRWSELWTTVLARFAYSTFEYAVWLMMIAIWSHLKGRSARGRETADRLIVCFFYCLAVWPASLLNTTNINIDASVGVLIAGLLSAVVMLFASPAIPRWGLYVPLAAVAFFSGFGKNEVSIVLIIATIVCGAAYLLAWALKINRAGGAGYLPVLVITVAGNLAGNYFNYSFDPVNYMAGFDVLHLRGSQTSLLGTGDIAAWTKVFLARLPFILIHLVLWGMTAWQLIRRLHQVRFPALLTFLYGSALFFGYFISYAEVGARYFEPALIALTASFLLLNPRIDFSQAGRKWFAVFLIICAVHSTAEVSATIVRVARNPGLLQSRFVVPEEVKNTGCIPVLEQADAFHRSDIDYVAYEHMKPLVESKGKKLCSRPYINR